ncbi:hypothetical protein [Yinghuangia sp. YIM S09857]|uniref:hypothetical protein n=1 Tax=Yinghuangia sp. YIM S09857 TaxID=3436929 RepID=UPI003F5331E4
MPPPTPPPASEPMAASPHATLRGPTNTVELRLVRRAVTGQDPDAPDTLEAAFNTPDATVIARLAASTAPDLTVRLRHHRVAGDIGLLVLECMPDNAPRSERTTTETTRQSPDGFWRYAVPVPTPTPT